MSLRVEPREKKKRKNSPPSSSPSFSLLPNEVTVSCLARIPRSYYPTISTVSKSFMSLLFSNELYVERSHLGNTKQYLYVCRWDLSYKSPQWYTLCLDSYRTLQESMDENKKPTRKLFVRLASSNGPFLSKTTVVAGYEIYKIGGPVYAPSSIVQILDCSSHIWRDAPSMNVAREYASSCFYCGKIYVFGGCKGLEDDESWAEVFDTKTQTWEQLPEPGSEIRKLNIDIIIGNQGKIKFGNSKNIYAYDTKQGVWECCVNESATFPRSRCVIENVSYSYCRNYEYDPKRCSWYDVKGATWKEIKGLDSLRERHLENDYEPSSMIKLFRCGGKLVLIWEVCQRYCKKIYCAEIALEKRDGGEIWGNVEWVDIVQTVPISCQLMHCLTVSV